MDRETQHLSWVTPARYVGPAMVIIVLIAGVLAIWFVLNGRFDEAVVALLFAICFLLIGIADLLGKLIMLNANETSSRT